MHLRTAFIIAILLSPCPALADECRNAAMAAEREFSIPTGLLVAIGIRESRFNGRMWPWSVNELGKARRYATRGDAEKAVSRLVNNSDRFDLGCFQIHWRWLGKSCATNAVDLFDTTLNARCAGMHLRKMYSQSGSWGKAVQAYHVGPNRSERDVLARAEAYECRVGKTFANLYGRSADC